MTSDRRRLGLIVMALGGVLFLIGIVGAVTSGGSDDSEVVAATTTAPTSTAAPTTNGRTDLGCAGDDSAKHSRDNDHHVDRGTHDDHHGCADDNHDHDDDHESERDRRGFLPGVRRRNRGGRRRLPVRQAPPGSEGRVRAGRLSELDRGRDPAASSVHADGTCRRPDGPALHVTRQLRDDRECVLGAHELRLRGRAVRGDGRIRPRGDRDALAGPVSVISRSGSRTPR